MKEYELKLISEYNMGVISHKFYQVLNYDGNKERLEEYVKQLNENCLFNIDWYIQDAEKGLLEKVVDTLD